MTRERNVLSQILKSWAQEHNNNYQIASPDLGDGGVDATSLSLTGLVKHTDAILDLVGLLDRLEVYVRNVKNKKFPDGFFCKQCGEYYRMAEPNQQDGSLICYSCRTNLYI